MSLFQTSVVKKYLNELSPELIDKKYTEFQAYFGNPEIKKNIRESKEEEYQSGFVSALFVNILSYTLKPDPNYNFVLEKKNVDDSKKADGAILQNNEVIAIIELKSTQTTDLDNVETQAFGYKNHNPQCRYIITSNFEKIRLYIQNAVDHIEFDLFNLTREDFALLWLCFLKDNILQDIPLKIKEASVLQEENVTKELYNDYSKFRKEIFNNIVKNNPEYDKLVLFKKTQKLLDRFLFIFFAEDRLLLPPNSISEIVKQWVTLKEDLDEYVPLYERFKKYFGYLNKGYKGKKYDIFPYNGGLFAPDEILDNIKIDDEILHKNTVQLSTYDFETEVDVNILGHIFEHSLGEIENVQAEIKGEQVDKQKTRRKKDGIFYTPKYITKYIVENTVGKLCEEKRNELEIIDEEYAKGRKNRKKDIVRALDDKLTAYRDWLLDITILDPACGSGAFLNQALEFLIQEHQKIDELRFQLLGGSIVFPDVETKILEKNIYGVDLNEESVEIAKLSLWLRTAQKGRKLTTLSNHIKFGNSLIDDPEIAGEKAFNWEKEFPEVFAKGGFDVVIGNPPYGASLSDSIKKNLSDRYMCFKGNYDIYSAFIQFAFEKIKTNAYWGFINPVSWQSNESYHSIRKYIKENGLLDICIKLPYDVFSDAYVDTGIYVAKKTTNNADYYSNVFDFPVRFEKKYEIIQNIKFKKLHNSYWQSIDSLKIVLNPAFYELLPKLSNKVILLKEICNSVRGILANESDIFEESKSDLKLFFTGNLYRYILQEDYKWIKFGDNLRERPKDYSFFQDKRILVRRLISRQFRVLASITDKEFVNKKDIYNLKLINDNYSLEYLLAIINSKLISYIKTKGSTNATKDDFSQLTLNDLREIPIKIISKEKQRDFSSIVFEIIEYNKLLNKESEFFLDTLKEDKQIQKITIKLLNFWKLEFDEFKKELKRQKVNFILGDETNSWREYFNKTSLKLNNILSELTTLDNKLDNMVYELYGLTEEEIKIVEKNIQ